MISIRMQNFFIFRQTCVGILKILAKVVFGIDSYLVTKVTLLLIKMEKSGDKDI